MSRQFTRDFGLEVRKGNVAGHLLTAIIGHSDTLTTSQITIAPSLTTQETSQSTINRVGGTPAVVSIASTSANDTSAGSGARTVKIIGLDVNGDAAFETLTMNGQTAVEGAVVFSAINLTIVITSGGSFRNEGTVHVGTGTFTSGVPAVVMFSMEVNHNKGMTAMYTVPLGKTFYTTFFVQSMASQNKDVKIDLLQSLDGITFTTQAVFGLEPGEIQYQVDLPGVPAGSMIKIVAVSTGTTSVTVILNGVLVDD